MTSTAPVVKNADTDTDTYMAMTRAQLLEVAHNDGQFGEWFKAEASHMTFQEIVKALLDGHYGRYERHAGANAIKRHFERKRQ